MLLTWKHKTKQQQQQVGFYSSRNMWPEYAGTSKNLQILCNRPFHGIFNFWHGQVRENPSTLKKCLEINKTAKFEIDLLKVNEETAPQSHKTLQTFVWWGAQTYTPPYKHL